MKKNIFFSLLAFVFVFFSMAVTQVQATDLRCDPKLASSTKLCTDWFTKPATCQPDNRFSAVTGTPVLEGTCVLDVENSPEPTITTPQKGFSFDAFNPLNPELNGTKDVNAPTFKTPADVINRFVKLYAFPAAGLILFVMIVWGGFEMVAGATNTKSQDAGKQRITAAVIGFVILFAAYWIIQVIQAVFGVKIF